MKVSVDAKPGAREEKVERIAAGHYRISVKEPPHDGRANKRIAEVLGEHLDIPPSRIRLKSGGGGRKKIFEIT